LQERFLKPERRKKMEERQDRDKDRAMLRLLARTRESFLREKTAIGNRLGVKADGAEQNIPLRDSIKQIDQDALRTIWEATTEIEKKIEKSMLVILERFPFWCEWLSKVKGIGPNLGAWIIGEFDIEKASTVSKMWRFSGMCSGLVPGDKSIPKSKYKQSDGEIVGTLPPKKDGEERYRVRTDELIRADKKTPGFLCPYNGALRVVLLGRGAASFLRCDNKYVTEIYRPRKARHAASEATVLHRTKGHEKDTAWKDVSKMHADQDAKRVMMKAFLKDVYQNWRTIEGLPVRAPYAEEYLGKNHQRHNEYTEARV
jgi:uncharacterized membrane protein